jgi:exopolysaccharide production protein ExoZ
LQAPRRSPLLFLGAIDTTLSARLELRGIPAAVIVLSAIALERSSPITNRNGWLHFLGDASYSIYLSHLFAIVVLRALWLKLQFPATGPWHAALFTAIAVTGGTAFGCMVHITVERPLTRATRSYTARPTLARPAAVGSA